MTAPATSPWGSGGSTSGASAWGGGKPRRPQNPNQQTQPSGAPSTSPGQAQPPQTFSQMSQSGQARPAPPDNPGGQAGGLQAATAQALGGSSSGGVAPPAGNPQATPQSTPPAAASPGGLFAQVNSALGNGAGSAGTPSGASASMSAAPPPNMAFGDTSPTSGQVLNGPPPVGVTAPGPITPPPSPSNFSTASTSFAPANIGTPAVDANGQLTSAVQSALANPDPYASQTMQAQQKAGQATLDQNFAAQQKMLDEQMAARGIGASSIASGYYGDLAGQQATAEAGLQSNILTDEANRYQQGLATAFGAGNTLAGTQGAQNLGAAQLGTQASLGAGSLALGGRQLDQQGSQFTQSQAQQQGEFTTSDTTANRGLDIQNATNNNALNLQVASLLAQMGYTPGGATTGAPPSVNPTIPKNTPGSQPGSPGQQPYTPPGGDNGNPGGGTTLFNAMNGGGLAYNQTPSTQSPSGLSATTAAALGAPTPPTAAGTAAPPTSPSLSAQTAAALPNTNPLTNGQNGIGGNPYVPGKTALGQPMTAQGQVASGRPLEQQLLSLTPQQSQNQFGFALSRDPSSYQVIGKADANGVVKDAAGNMVGNSTPGMTVYADTTTGHMMPGDLLSQQPWWNAQAASKTAKSSGVDHNGNQSYKVGGP